MKKKILLKTLVVAAPLLGVISPLTSCVTNNDKELIFESNSINSTNCPIIVDSVDSHKILVNHGLVIPSESEIASDQEVNLKCEDDGLQVLGVGQIAAYRSGEMVSILMPGPDFMFEPSGSDARVLFYATGINKLRGKNPDYIRITPSSIGIDSYKAVVENPIVQISETEILNVQLKEGFNMDFEIKDDFKDLYRFDHLLESDFHVLFGKSTDLSQYEEIPEGEQWNIEGTETPSKIRIVFNPFDTSKYDPTYDSFSFVVPTIPKTEYDKEAKITLFSQPFATLSHSVAGNQTSFSIKMPLSYNEKKITKAKWTKKSEEGQHKWRNCKITFPEGNKYCLLENEVAESAPINDDIVINIEDVAPVDADHTFENESWPSLGYWVSKVYNTVLDDDGREKKLLQIYGLDENDTFIGRQKTVTWGEIPHTVKVASTFQLNTVKSGHTHDMLLDEDEVDFDHHAAFTFLFTNELTYENEHGATTLLTHNFDGDYDSDSNCWVEQTAWKETKYVSSDIRNYMRDGFVKKLSDRENIKSIVKPTASSHFTRTIKKKSERYICDTFAIPTGVQMNTFTHPESNSGWHTETKGDPVFELFENINPTESKNDFRNFKPTDRNIDPLEYWLSSPCFNEITSWSNDKCINIDGSLTDEDQDIELAVVPCFSI